MALTGDLSPASIFLNGRFVTLDGRSRIAEAVAVTDGRFTSVGTTRDVLQTADAATQVVDLSGRTVIPGFIDGHAHMDREGLKFALPSLAGAGCIDDILSVIANEVDRSTARAWIVTMPLGEHPEFAGAPNFLAERRYPTRWDLDRVSPDNPVYIKAPWHYWNGETPIVSVANSMALDLAGITRDTQAPHSGVTIVRDPSGEATGVFEETGHIGTVEYTLMRAVPQFDHVDRVEALRDSMRRYNAAGTTSVYEGHGVAPDVINAYQELDRHGELTVRSHLVLSPTWDRWAGFSIEHAFREMGEGVGQRRSDDEMLRIGGVHIEVAESIQDDIRKNSMSNPGWAGYSVDSVLSPARASLAQALMAAAAGNMRVNAIAHSSRLLDEYLDAIEIVNDTVSITDRRWVLQHLSFVNRTQLARLSDLGIHTTIVPGTTLWKHGLKRTSHLSSEAASEYLPLRSFSECGVPFAFGTDNVPINPLESIWAAVTRQDGATSRIVGPDQALSREEALRAFTTSAALLTFEEAVKGSIEVTKFADFAVLSADLMDVPADDIAHIEVESTVVGGRIVHNVEGLGAS